MATTALKRMWKNEYIQTVIMIVVIIVVVFGFWFGSQFILNTQYPALTVASGSMCKTQWINCDGWSHPFDRTLHVGDLIIVQGVNADEIHAAPEPEGDIIVFHQIISDDLIVHRAIAETTIEGKLFFQTKGDGNGGPDEETPSLPADRVVGRVVMRIPWIGHLALFMHDSSVVYIILILIALLVIIEIIIPGFRNKPEVEKGQITDATSTTQPHETAIDTLENSPGSSRVCVLFFRKRHISEKAFREKPIAVGHLRIPVTERTLWSCLSSIHPSLSLDLACSKSR